MRCGKSCGEVGNAASRLRGREGAEHNAVLWPNRHPLQGLSEVDLRLMAHLAPSQILTSMHGEGRFRAPCRHPLARRGLPLGANSGHCVSMRALLESCKQGRRSLPRLGAKRRKEKPRTDFRARLTRQLKLTVLSELAASNTITEKCFRLKRNTHDAQLTGAPRPSCPPFGTESVTYNFTPSVVPEPST
jgi:hypothetical protein